MGNLCTKDSGEDYIKNNKIIFEETINIDPKKFNSDYSITWDNKIKVWLFID
tara:strand:+ start:973 stop:1128 length:156 start_codon:yes stop_codon:yes gene_type:complete